MTRSIAVTIYTKVFFNDDDIDEFREDQKLHGTEYDTENDAIYAYAMDQINVEGAKVRDMIPDISSIKK